MFLPIKLLVRTKNETEGGVAQEVKEVNREMQESNYWDLMILATGKSHLNLIFHSSLT